jgi:long-chain acyl-CoA synthetase
MRIDTSVPSIPHLLLDRLAASPWAIAFESRSGAGWRTHVWAEVGLAVRELSAGLIASGLRPGDRGAVLAGTRLEWVLIDLALLCAGLATTAVHPTTTPDEWRFILGDAGCVALFVEDGQPLARLGPLDDLPVRLVVRFDGAGQGAIGFDELRARGREWLATHGIAAWEHVARSVGPEDLATLIYTSGTTGRPKGVRLVHDGWMAQARALAPVVDELREPGDKLYLWLPLAHAYGKVLELAVIAYGVPAAIDGDLDRLATSLAECRPSWVPAVPRVFEKMRERMIARAAERGPRALAVFRWAERVAIAESRLRRSGSRVPAALRAQHALAERLVYRRIRQAFGGRVRAFLSGSAPLSADLQHFFDGAGLPILEGYGLTECSAVATANRPGETRFGSVGKAAPGMEVAIGPEGEVLLRGRAVMRGYHQRPDANATALRDGWFHTGDLGRLDDDGFLHVTGRIKELIVTAGGKKIGPLPIEAAVKARCPLIQEVVMVGDRRPYCVALIALEAEPAFAWARQHGLAEHLPSIAVHPALRAELGVAVDAVNATLASYQQIKAFDVLSQTFSIEGGELTPTQKVKRAEVTARHADRVEALYRP